jgi:putative hydrolase
VDPVTALRRIAYLLEWDRAETYKVRAFRNAAAAIADLDPASLSKLGLSGLKRIKGVGDTTAQVIAEALEGATPSYLESLEGRERRSVDGPAADIRERLRGDCHSHSDWSDGGSTIEEMACAARDLGHEYLVLTDHSPRLTVAHGLDRERLLAQLDVVESINARMAPFRILTGMEVDILEDGGLDQDDDMLGRLDVVVASVHSKLKMSKPEMTRRMVRAIESPHTDILGHCTGRILVGRGRPPSTFDADAVFESCAATGTAVEINSRPERRDPPHELLSRAVELGCRFALDTDAHAPGQLEWLDNGCEQAVAAGIGPERIVNTSSAPDLLSWAAAH